MPRYVNCIHGDSQSRFLFAKVCFLLSLLLSMENPISFLIDPRRQNKPETNTLIKGGGGGSPAFCRHCSKSASAAAAKSGKKRQAL